MENTETLTGYNMPLSLEMGRTYYFYGHKYGTFAVRVHYEKGGAGYLTNARRGYYLTIQQCEISRDTVCGRDYACVRYEISRDSLYFDICLKNVTRASTKQARAALDLAPLYIAGYFDNVTNYEKDINFISNNALTACYTIESYKSFRTSLAV